MEKLFNTYDKEYMRMAMLKHEETFREQVYELHRLYQIQKLLMKNIASSRKRGQESERRSFKIAPKPIQTNDHEDIHEGPRQSLDLELRFEEYVPLTQGNGTVKIDDESELELTLGLGPSSHCTGKKVLETSIYSDSAASFSSSSTGSNHIKRTNSGTPLRTNTNREELIGWKWGLDHLHSSNPSVLGARKSGSEIEEQFRQDRHNNPPWLLQALSLNTT